MTIIESLAEIQSTLKAPKNQRNNFGNYNYRSAEDILEAVKPLIGKMKVALTITDDVCGTPDGVFIKSTARLTDGEQEISVSAFAKHPDEQKGMSPSQITGATSSYARKYALNGLFCIDDNKDPDTDEFRKEDDAKAEPKSIKTSPSTVKSDSGSNAKPLPTVSF